MKSYQNYKLISNRFVCYRIIGEIVNKRVEIIINTCTQSKHATNSDLNSLLYNLPNSYSIE